MTRRELIVELLRPDGIELSCQDMCKIIIKEEKLTGNKAKYLSGSTSSLLNRLVKLKVLYYSKNKTTRGGYLYKLKAK